MTALTGHWFKPGYSRIHLIRDVNKEWTRDNGGMVCPEGLKARYGEDVCLLAQNPPGRMVNGLVSVLFSNLSVEGECIHEYWLAAHLIEPVVKP